MSQISMPIRIALGVAVAVIAVYMVALRPKSEAPAPPPAATPAGNVAKGRPAVTGFGKAVESAKGAVAATNGQQTKEGTHAGLVPAKHAGSTHVTKAPGAPAGAASATPAADTSGLPGTVAKAIHAHEVLALLFTNRVSADDRAVERAVRHAERRFGRHTVFVKTVPLKAIARYGRITRGADVQQSPTLVLVDRALHATTLVGYADALTVDQALVDSLRASGGLFPKDRYLTHVNNACSSVAHDMSATPEATTLGQAHAAVHARMVRFDSFVHDLRTTPAPARYTGLKHSLVTNAGAQQRAVHTFVGNLGPHPSVQRLVSSMIGMFSTGDPAGGRFNRIADRHHLIYCGELG